MSVRRATIDDLEAVCDLRLAMWNEMHPEAPATATMRDETTAWLRANLEGEGLRAWLVEDDGASVGVALLLVHEHPPRIAGREVRGYVTAVFVRVDARRRGHARAMMTAIVDHARAHGFRRLMLRSSDAGRHVYESVGFRAMEVLAQDF